MLMTSGALFPQFLSTPSGWRATALYSKFGANQTISIHALRVEGDKQSDGKFKVTRISIHALRVEGDPQSKVKESKVKIYIHALRVEGDSS